MELSRAVWDLFKVPFGRFGPGRRGISDYGSTARGKGSSHHASNYDSPEATGATTTQGNYTHVGSSQTVIVDSNNNDQRDDNDTLETAEGEKLLLGDDDTIGERGGNHQSKRRHMGRFLAHLLLIVALAGLRLAAGYYSITAAASVIGHLVDGDRRMAFRSLGVSAAFMAASAVLRAVFTLQAELASIVWRRALVTRLHGLYTDDRSALYYTLRGVDYPDQRIAKDATDFCDMFVTLVDTLALSPPTIAMYTYLAWRSVGWLAPTVIYVYFVLGWTFTRWVVMGPVVRTVAQQERLEGELRGRHGGIVSAAEALAFSERWRPFPSQHSPIGGPERRGETKLCASLNECLATALRNRTKLAYGRFGLGLFSHTYAYAGTVLVYAFIAIAVMDGPGAPGEEETAGELSAMISRSVSFCISLMAGFTAFIDASPLFSDWAGYAIRVSGILWALEDGLRQTLRGSCDDPMAAADGHRRGPDPPVTFTDADHLSMHRVTVDAPARRTGPRVKKPNGILLSPSPSSSSAGAAPSPHTLIRALTFKVPPRTGSLLITGPSGSGKTSILRVLMGLWQQSAGGVSRPCGDAVMAVPQGVGAMLTAIGGPLPTRDAGKRDGSAAPAPAAPVATVGIPCDDMAQPPLSRSVEPHWVIQPGNGHGSVCGVDTNPTVAKDASHSVTTPAFTVRSALWHPLDERPPIPAATGCTCAVPPGCCCPHPCIYRDQGKIDGDDHDQGGEKCGGAQRPTPRDAMSDPGDLRLRWALETVGLSWLPHRAGDPSASACDDWRSSLSPGELQRLSLARLLFHSPRVRFALLDEATSQVDAAAEERVYGALRALGIAVVSVTHGNRLGKWHDQVLTLTGDGGWRIDPIQH